MAILSRELEFAFVTFGIYSSYLLLGYAQESVYAKVPGSAPFIYSEFMVFVQCLIGILAATTGDRLFSSATKQPEETQTGEYGRRKLMHGAIYMGAMAFTNTSLLYVSYPTQALAKSCKILPVMLSGLFVKHIKYHWLQYLSVLMITVGVLEFQLLGGKTGGHDTLLGLLLLFGSLACDGCSGYLTVRLTQEVIRHEHKPSSFQMMKYLNTYGCLLTLPAVLLLSLLYHPTPVWTYIAENPNKWTHILAFGLTSAVGQVFIFKAIVTFGALTLTVITTTRKFFTVFLSIFIFAHSLNTAQWGCVALVLLGSTLDGASKYLLPVPKEKK